MDSKESKITTSVYIVDLPFTVDLCTAFALIPTGSGVGQVQEIAFGDLKRSVDDDAGEELLKRTESEFAFPNSVNLKISVREKTLMIKLCPTLIHVTGVKKRSQCEEVYGHICEIITSIQRDIEAARQGSRAAIERLAERRRIPRSEFESFREWLLNSSADIAESPDECSSLAGIPHPVMINKHYKVNVPFNLATLAEELSTAFETYRAENRRTIERGEDFTLNVAYNNAVQNNVLVWVNDSDLPPRMRAPRGKLRKDPIHRIFINSTGAMTQMGPDERSMSCVFEHFVRMLGRTVYAHQIPASFFAH